MQEEEGETSFPADVSSKIRHLVQQGKLNVQFFPTKNTICHKAILDTKISTLAFLLTFERRLKINLQNKDGDTALHLAIRNHAVPDALIKKMIACKSKLNVRNGRGLSPFVQLFLSHRSEDLILHCWQRGGKIKTLTKKRENVLILLLNQLLGIGTSSGPVAVGTEEHSKLFELFSLILEPIEVYNNLTLILTRGDRERGMRFMRQLKKDYCVDLNGTSSRGDTPLHVLAKATATDPTMQANTLIFLNAILRFPGIDLSITNGERKRATDYLGQRSPIRELLINYHKLWDAERQAILEEMRSGIEDPDRAQAVSLPAPSGGTASPGWKRRQGRVRVEDVVDDHVNINTDYQLETKKTFVFAKGKVYEELLKTESTYCRDMTFLYHYYFSDLLRWKKSVEALEMRFYWRPGEEIREAKEIADTGIFQMINSIELIMKVNGELLSTLKGMLTGHPIFNMPNNVEEKVLTLFTAQGTFGRLMEYYQFYSSIQKAKIDLEAENRYLKEYLIDKDERYGLLDSYLIKPIQRLPRYVLMLRELERTYDKFEIRNSNLQLVRDAKDYVASVCAKINLKKLQARQARYTLELSQYFREQFQIEILATRKLSYVFHDMDLVVLDSWPFRARRLKMFMFSTVIYLAYQEVSGPMGAVRKKELLLTFTEDDDRKILMKITDDNHFSVKLMDATNQVICYFLVKFKNAFNLIYTIQENFPMIENPMKFRLFCLEERQQDDLFKFQRIVIT